MARIVNGGRRNLTGGPRPGISNPRPPMPGQGPPIIQGGTMGTMGNPGGPPHGTNAQGYDMIRYGQNNDKWGYAKVGQARNQPGAVNPNTGNPYDTGWGQGGNGGTQNGQGTGGGGNGGGGNGNPNADFHGFNQNIKAALQAYGQSNIFGANSIPTGSTGSIQDIRQGAVASMRQLLKAAQAAGVKNKGLMNMMRPSVYRGLSDPNGGTSLMHWASKNLSDEEFKALAKFGNTNSVTKPSGMNSVQTLLGNAVPGISDHYMVQANSYKIGPDSTNAMSTTPPGALLGSDGKWHDPEMPLKPGVTLDPTSNPSAISQDRWWGGPNNRFQGTGIFADDPNYMQNSLNREGATSPGPNAATGMDPQVAALGGMGANPAAGGAGAGGATNMSTPNGGTPTGGPSYGGYTSTFNSEATANSPGAQNGGGAGNAPTYGGGASAMMPPTANFEAANRGIEDQLSASLAALGVAREQIPAEIARIMARITTDQTYGLQGLYSDLGERGLTLPGAGAYMLQRDVALPSGRAAQDAALDAAQNYSNLSANEGSAYLQASQGTVEALLQRAQELIDSMPLGLSQSRGNLQTQRRNNRRRNNKNKGKGKGKGGNR